MSGRREGDGDGSAIRALDERTVQRIAAGEVVERPASVVKELVENSLDADATRVSVAVERGGKEGVRVRDDGVGMSEADLERAVEKHTTSKIEDVNDLEGGVGTLGFRGEALHTVGAVSRLTLRSRPRGGAGAGAELEVEGGDVGEVRPAGCPTGTTVEVEDLFYNTPARRKFLKTDATEFDHVNTVVTHYALANPGVAVSLEHDGREVFATEGGGDLRSAVLSVYGREVAESMVEVDARAGGGSDGDGDDGETGPTTRLDAGPVKSVTGLVSHPETTRSGREYLSTFVNGRYVTAAPLREAVLDAYGGQLASDRYPFAALFVDVPPGSVDVNVHPRKMEVRFDDEAAVRDAVERAVREALLDHGLVRSGAPRGRSAPDETPVSPGGADGESGGSVVGGAGTDHERASGVSSRSSRRDRTPSRVAGADAADETDEADATDGADAPAPTGESGVRADGTASDRSAAGRALGASEDAGSHDGASAPEADAERAGERGDGDDGVHAASSPEGAADRPSPRRWQSEESGDGVDRDAASTELGPGPTGARSGDPSSVDEPAGETDLDAYAGEADRKGPNEGEEGTGADDRTTAGVAAPTTQRTLDGEAATAGRSFERLPRLRVLGQFDETYVVAESDDGLVLIDQHAADERVNYERLRREVRGETPTQALADPVELELTAREAALFEQYREALARLGFHAGRIDDRRVEVRTVPAVFDAALDPGLLRDALTGFAADEADGGRETVDAVADDLLADLACYPSITGNTSLTEGSVVDLLASLDDCENPYACPHGRPVIVELDREEIRDRFERDYPGHAGRRG